jgi:hypothetical protein
MYRKFLNARSPLRLLEKGLHGGLGKGNLGLVLAGPGVGKTACLVGIALDDLLRGGHVLHVALDQTVAHVRAFYDTVFDDLSSSTHLEDAARVHAEANRCRSIRAYPAGGFSAAKLREAAKFEAEAGARPELVIVEGFDLAGAPPDELRELKVLAGELPAEIWLSASVPNERVSGLPAAIRPIADLLSVVLALEPGDSAVALRALKDHDSPDLSALHVALDPRTLLLKRS